MRRRGGVDATAFRRFQMQKLVPAPGEHTIKVLYMAPGASWAATGEGTTTVTHRFEADGTYIVRYRRTEPKNYKVWIEPIESSRTEVSNSVCLQPPFEDPRYWQ